MLGDRLKKARKDSNLTQELLAQKVSTTKGTISNYENGHSTPSNEMLVLLANALDTTTDYLLGRSNSTSTYREAGISDTAVSHLTAYQKEVMDFILSRENLFFKNKPEDILEALEQFEVYYEVYKKQQEKKK
ncbi:helix-turn-helix domain-containing protein [Chungangia koreensis]|uniref:Helix-turn-helix domain-containing protein n=1 Tax=Chungangia koreensis TaxID=752657 RepID=A0ABV8XBA5_9LACT